jgi:molecular chaperone GrpE
VHRALLAALERAGATTIDPYGSPFDPAEHEALLAQPDPTVDEGVVLQVHQRGFRLGDRVIRPARVVIATAPAEGV